MKIYVEFKYSYQTNKFNVVMIAKKKNYKMSDK